MQLKSTAWILAALMCGAAIAGVAGKPSRKTGEFPRLESVVPERFGQWTLVRDTAQVIMTAITPTSTLMTASSGRKP